MSRRSPTDDGAAVQVGPGASIRADPPCQHQLLRVGAQPLAEREPQLLGQVECALHVRLGGPRAHDPLARTPAQQQIEGMGEHRLARAGLARQHVQPGTQPQLCPLDQQQVLDT